MQLAAFCDLDVGTEQFFHRLGEGLADISAISQDVLDGLQKSAMRRPNANKAPLRSVMSAVVTAMA